MIRIEFWGRADRTRIDGFGRNGGKQEYPIFFIPSWPLGMDGEGDEVSKVCRVLFARKGFTGRGIAAQPRGDVVSCRSVR